MHSQRQRIHPAAAAALLLLLGGCYQMPETVAPLPVSAEAKPLRELVLSVPADAPFEETVVLAQRKRIMGRTRSLEQIRRVADEISPLVESALRQPAIQGDLGTLARAAGQSLDDYRDEFARFVEADLLLESGGDPDAHSVADAIGVAQFLASTGRSAGLKVNLAESRRLSRKMGALRREIGYLQEKPPGWTKPAPPAASSDASWTAEQWIEQREREWQSLRMKRRQVDERYDPAKAIKSQVRYLVRLTRRYGSIDWALQAYHGGEGGVAQTLSLYATGRRSLKFNRSYLASRGGARAGGRSTLSWMELYQQISPTSRQAAFSYVYGRSDDHRYYLMKVLMARRAIAGYREDPTRFEQEWRALHPGNWPEAAWYPEIASKSFADYAVVRAAYRSGDLVRLPAEAGRIRLVASRVAPLDLKNAYQHKGLRPEAMELLLRIARLYHSSGGKETLYLTAMTQPQSYRRAFEAKHLKKPARMKPAFPVPEEPEFHTTGYAFDLQPPRNSWDRKVLQYAIGYYYDRLYLTWHSERREGYHAYHVVPNPGRREALLGRKEVRNTAAE